jgi:hypothetical protein
MIGCAHSLGRTFAPATSHRIWRASFFRQLQMLDDATNDGLARATEQPLRETAWCWKDFTRSASTTSGGSSLDGMAAEVRHRLSISIITAICEVFHVDDEAQAGNSHSNSDSGILGAHGAISNWAASTC